jgi:putative membrane protein
MKHLVTILYSGLLMVASLPALAQAASDAPVTGAPPYGYGPMWMHGHHMWGGWGFHPFWSILLTLLLIALVVGAFRRHWFGYRYGHGHFRHGYGRGSSALDILEERFARGEIDQNEFEQKRKVLTR